LNKIQDQSDYIRIIFNTIKNRADYEGQVLRKLEKIIDSNKENSVESIKQIAKVIEKRDGLFNGIIDNDKNISNLIFSVKEDFNSLKKIIKSINENEKLRPKIDSPTIKKIVNESKRDSLNKIIQSINNSEKSRPKLNSDIIRKIVNDSRKESIKERRSILNAIKNLEFKLKILEKEIKNIKVNTGQEYDDAFVERELLPFKILAGVK
jgi:ribosomal protein L17